MKVGLLSQWFAPEPGGGAVPAVLGRGLVDRGHHVQALTAFPNYPVGRIYDGYRQGLRVREQLGPAFGLRRVPVYANHDQRALRRSLNYLSFAASARVLGVRELRDRDAIWVYNSPATVPLLAEHLRRRRGVPFVLHVMDVWPDSVTDSGMMSAGRLGAGASRALDSMVARGYRGADRIAVTSPGQIDLLASRGVPRAKLVHCPLWADEGVFSPRPPDRSLLPAAARDAGVVLMYAGAIGHVQGLGAAVRAAAAVDGSGLHLVLVGSGIAEEELRDQTRSSGASNIHFMGRRSPEDMGDVGSAADAHLVSLADTPLLRRTMPSKLASVLALARPVVLSGAGDAADVVDRAGAGLVVRQPDGLVEAFRTLAQVPRSTLEDWGARGLACYQREFSYDRGVAHVETLLVEAAAGARAIH